MNVLVTGANGLLGSCIVKLLLKNNYTVKALVRSSSNLDALNEHKDQIEFIEGDVLDISSLETATENVDYVIHAAAIVSFVKKEAPKMFQVNIEGTANVVNVCLKKPIKKLVFISSVAALGRPQIKQSSPIIIDETQKWEDSPNNSNYAISKFKAESEVWRAHAEGLPVVIVNPSIILGESSWNQSSTRLFKYAYDPNPFFPPGNINYVDVLDVANIALKLMESEITGERFIANAGNMPFEGFFAKVATQMGRKPPTIKLGLWFMQVFWRIEALRSLLTGSSPLITKETTQTAKSNHTFSNNKVINDLNFKFTSLDSSVTRVSKYLLSRI